MLVGVPSTPLVVFTVIEVASVPGLICWQYVVAKRTKRCGIWVAATRERWVASDKSGSRKQPGSRHLYARDFPISRRVFCAVDNSLDSLCQAATLKGT